MVNRAPVHKLGYGTNQNAQKSELKLVQQTGHPIPLYKFSQDIQRYEKMLHVLGLYRLTFGQPRQEELVEALNCEISAEELDKLLIDLCPMRRAEGKTKNKPKA